jgi:hemerythrin-like domain-containing protein
MHLLLERLNKDHANLSKVLDLLTTQLDHFFAGRESDFDLKIELLEYIETYADQGHHPLEELIFEVAMRRMGERSELLERLESQHKSLVMLTRKFRRSLEGVLQDGVMLREELEVQGREFIALQRQHIDLEDHDAFPLLDSVMTESDWQEVSENMPRHDDPVFEAPDKVRFQTVFDYLKMVS